MTESVGETAELRNDRAAAASWLARLTMDRSSHCEESDPFAQMDGGRA